MRGIRTEEGTVVYICIRKRWWEKNKTELEGKGNQNYRCPCDYKEGSVIPWMWKEKEVTLCKCQGSHTPELHLFNWDQTPPLSPFEWVSTGNIHTIIEIILFSSFGTWLWLENNSKILSLTSTTPFNVTICPSVYFYFQRNIKKLKVSLDKKLGIHDLGNME
jgi:hypothetical protein